MSEFVPDKLPGRPNGQAFIIDKLDEMIAQCEAEVMIRRASLLQQEAALVAMIAEANRIKAARPLPPAKE